jgi:hypothetical protein
MALPTQLEDASLDLIQVKAESSDDIPASMDDMKSMIDGAMKQEYTQDLGEASGEGLKADMKQTMDEIAEKEAIADEMEMEQKRDCVVTQWTGWTECSKKCGGGKTKRSRKIQVNDQNGGEKCPTGLEESAACNTESCESDEKALREKSRHLTQVEKDKETEANNQVLSRAMAATSVAAMQREMSSWIKMNTATSMVNILAPQQEEPTDEDEIQKVLQQAMAQNTVANAMAGFEDTQKETPKEEAPAKGK